MKRLAICAGCLVASLTIFAQAPQSYKGEIMDSQCAALGGHSIMEQKGESPKDCTNRCVGMGGRYTLFDPATKKLIWRGSATDTLSDKPDKNIKNLDKGVTKMFEHFPPDVRKEHL